MLLFYFQTNKQKISSLQVVLKEELHTDTLPGQAESPFVEQEAHPAENSLCLCAFQFPGRALGILQDHLCLNVRFAHPLKLAVPMVDQDWIKFQDILNGS